MPNPYLPLNEYIPDGEPRVFGDRVYVYGSHDSAGSESFCDYKLKVWSAPVNDLNNWVCHGDSFHSADDRDHKSDTDWTIEGNQCYAPDVIKYKDKYYLYAYIMGAKGCVAVSDKPEGPFTLISKYKYNIDNHYDDGTFIDPGVLVDDDGRVYVYCGFQGSYMAEINSENMYEIIDGSYKENILTVEPPHNFFEACSPRKVGDIYYMIYSPCRPNQEGEGGGSRLCYATSSSPTGPFEYRGTIVDNSQDYPGGNNHGSICNINGQWYIFYHRMTNGTIMSRRACVEKIEIHPDGTIPQVEMTSLGFDDSLNPYKETPADIACVLKGGCLITEKNVFSRPITNITDGCVIGYKYYDFGEDYSSKTMEIAFKVKGHGMSAKVIIYADGESGMKLGECNIGADDGVYTSVINSLTGRHSIFFVIEKNFGGWFKDMTNGRQLFELESFIFIK